MDTAKTARAGVGLRGERGPILLATMLSLGLVAIDSTILATAVRSIVTDLGGFTQFPWLFSIYLLAQAVTVPLYAKVSDMIGRKPVMLVGIGLFLLGSLLCGVSWSMGSLIAFRAIQGIGAGAVQPMSMTIVADIYTLEERAKVQGYVASVWALSAVLGPTLGGAFSEYLSWRWIFFVNVPLGLAAAWMLWRRFDERVERRAHHIDYLGSFLLTTGAVVLLLALLEGGVRWAWASGTTIGLLAAGVVLLIGFVVAERRAVEPVLPLWVFRHRVVVSAILGSLVVGVLLMGLSSFVPLYAQSVLGHSALVSGLALAAMTLGWPIASTYAGRLYLSIGFRATILIGGAVGFAGAALLLLVNQRSSIWHLAGPCFVMGLGFALVAVPSIIAAQTSVTWEHRGVATGTIQFARSVGGAVGVAVFGAIANGVVAARLGHAVPDLKDINPDILAAAIRPVFVASATVATALLLVGLLMVKRVEPPGVSASDA
ncbi:DHA2 family efflux MFS transporter permease subunit [Mycolicibacterium sp. P9-64]|uniref:MDR family MFS transporter n=1 Tax=Mycolicibacterium sp. P9-64 TaxID=2024612 RepID=UPI0011F09152|nr:MDR family MFS transporter [Mycolicibacterium sp. P9-64]KAA0085592.1 DHA2 family efflux MFS transporter permease subunit [Mycolicibacterium sp. P9-64]